MRKSAAIIISIFLGLVAGIGFALINPEQTWYISPEVQKRLQEGHPVGELLCASIVAETPEELARKCYRQSAEVRGFPFRASEEQSVNQRFVLSAANFIIGFLTTGTLAFIFLSHVKRKKSGPAQ